ncbi:hypothetical protein HGO34_16460 [Agrobacterium vitis]|uniref:Uncharacterized protein n=1 Tax=Agrobacterium vitis TaxID=373 RepID=A0AAE4W8U3_AGRVI|nr:hypothetical protein [Agrobacterium vitis]MCF1497794.1 hypothetical protein [Allorhizobium sp. Av2]MCM2441316.1 hypothetical protein [Agrobacterium vitis]MUZ55934.1 hypothetical protein [Agrobacterium vitis]MVA68742.1 hypothetical protein [Agrobacterium vitis]MVA89524.1 hypothetical protein [Agrobacterium vitis]
MRETEAIKGAVPLREDAIRPARAIAAILQEKIWPSWLPGKQRALAKIFAGACDNSMLFIATANAWTIALDDIERRDAEIERLNGMVLHFSQKYANLAGYRDELFKIAAEVGEPGDPFAAWESVAALKAENERLKTLVTTHKAAASVSKFEAATPAPLFPNSGCDTTICSSIESGLHDRAILSSLCHKSPEATSDA